MVCPCRPGLGGAFCSGILASCKWHGRVVFGQGSKISRFELRYWISGLGNYLRAFEEVASRRQAAWRSLFWSCRAFCSSSESCARKYPSVLSDVLLLRHRAHLCLPARGRWSWGNQKVEIRRWHSLWHVRGGALGVQRIACTTPQPSEQKPSQQRVRSLP